MSSSGRKGKKTKYRPVSVETILPNAIVRPVSSWAEEVESELLNEYSIKKISTINLPTAPRAACDLVIDDSKISQNGPFIAYLTNLPYEITEDDISQQFKELKIANIRLPKDDRQDRMKGFGYVEFQDKSNLIAALQEGELQLKGRCVRISLPSDEEPNRDRGMRSGGTSFGRNRDSDRSDRADKPLTEWRAGAPVPHDPDKSASSRPSVGFTRPMNRERDGGFRDFKSNFQPAEPSSSFSRTFRDDRDGRAQDRGNNRMFKRFDRDDRMSRDDRSGRDREDRMGRSAFSRKFEREDREIRREPKEPEREEPKQRPRIEIQPRSIPLDANRTPESLPASIFGGAKPVDTAKRELEMEAKLTMANATTRSTSPLTHTPSSNLSRSSSVSSLSCNRKNEPVDDDCHTADSLKHEGNGTNVSVSYETNENDKPKQLENVWKQRSAALAAASADKGTAAPSSVMNNAEAVNNSSDTLTFSCTPTVCVDDSEEIDKRNVGNSPKETSRSTTKLEDSQKWTTYSPETFDESQSRGSSRFGNNRHNDKPIFNRDNRDNRRDRREGHREGDRRPYRDFKNRDEGSETTTSGRKWTPRDGGGGFKSRNNDFGGSRRQDRDNFRDRNESRPNQYRAFNSSNNSRNENDFGRHRHEDRRKQDERLNGNERPNVHVEAQSETDDSRLKENTDNTNSLENGNDDGGEAVDRTALGSSENIVSGDQSETNDDAFKSRKKHKKKKNNLEQSDRDDKSVDNDRKIKNSKEEKKNNDNYQITDAKNGNKNNVKNKENAKTIKKSRGPRDDVTQMSKQKDETPKDFQDKNRFDFLPNDDN